MDYQLVALIGLMLAVVVFAASAQRRRSGWEYQRVFSTGFAGLLFFIAGFIGWDLRYSHEWFQGTTWVDDPVWWQVGLGAALLLLAGFWARRVPSRLQTR